MKTRIGFSILTLLAVGSLGLALGTIISGRHPDKVLAMAPAMAPAAVPVPDDGKLRIIIFGAHPDDAEYFGAGVAMKWAKAGHHVKLVSATNGDVGHWQIAGGPLAQRRKAEVLEVARKMGVTSEVLDIHDGEITPTLENRRTFTRLIRQWNADIVITNRPNDYHPDHRYTSILVQDSAYMVTVPFFGLDEPPLKKNPVFAYAADRFKRPYPFTPDLAVAIDDVLEPTLDALLVMESQIHEGGANGNAALFPAEGPARQQRRDAVRKSLANRYARTADTYRDTLVKFYGEAGRTIRHAQAFEICEYGSQPTQDQLRKLFPF